MKVLKTIVSFSAVIAATIYLIVLYLNENTDTYQYMILTLLILIATSSLIMDVQYTSKFDEFVGKKNMLIDESSIQRFDSVDMFAEELSHMVRRGKHIVDFVSIDTSLRTGNADKRRVMHKVVQTLFRNEDVQLTYITRIRSENAMRFFANMNTALSANKNDLFAYYENSENGIPFASFIVVDDKYVFTRSPYDVGQTPTYLVVRNKVLAQHFKDWVRFIWKEAQKITSENEIEELYNRMVTSLSAEEKSRLSGHLEEIKNKMRSRG